LFIKSNESISLIWVEKAAGIGLVGGVLDFEVGQDVAGGGGNFVLDDGFGDGLVR
jgi:hypothetical protein